MLFLAQPNFDTTPCISRVSVIRSTCRQHKQPNQPTFSILGFLGLSLTLGLRQSKSQNTASKVENLCPLLMPKVHPNFRIPSRKLFAAISCLQRTSPNVPPQKPQVDDKLLCLPVMWPTCLPANPLRHYEWVPVYVVCFNADANCNWHKE